MRFIAFLIILGGGSGSGGSGSFRITLQRARRMFQTQVVGRASDARELQELLAPLANTLETIQLDNVGQVPLLVLRGQKR